ncbi:MAG: hypothetical protein KFF73_08885 [Cyclobacteriaceae bacterium]|nr:hypothetical protein [Cyclobacteriaceae bacterium]
MKFLLKPVISITLPLFWLLLSSQAGHPVTEKVKIFELNGRMVKVTHQANPDFYGKYQGEKGGYLLLGKDGSGEYLYDIQIPEKGCRSGVIHFEWGFIIDENDEILRFERNYGYSYPVVLKCTGDYCFQGCRVRHMVDYILDKKSGALEVSSSDDWIKETD